MYGDTRCAILEIIDYAITEGLSQYKACNVLQIDERRIQRWRKQITSNPDNPHGRQKHQSKSHKPYNALTPEERDIVSQMIASEEHADASCRLLSIKTMEEHEVYISPVTYWQHMKDQEINGPRGVNAKRNNHHTKPDIGEVTEPNQIWSWDITFLKTLVRYQHFYLYSLLDNYSRKIIAWLISDRLTSDNAQSLWDQALINENLLNVPTRDLPQSLSDRGSQMRSHSTRQFFRTLGIDQHFSRPRTPNDNPQIEAFFSTVKNCPDYPDRFETLEEAVAYFQEFMNWYNYHHYHTALGMITPADYHNGKAAEIISERNQIKQATLENRRKVNSGTLIIT